MPFVSKWCIHFCIYCIGYRPGVTPDQLVDIASDPVYTWFYTQGNQISTQTAAKFVQLFGQCKYNILNGDRHGFSFQLFGQCVDKYFLLSHIVDGDRQGFYFKSPREGLRVYKFDTNYVLWGTTPPKEAPTNCVGSLEQVVNEFIVYGEYLVYIYYLMIRKHNN